MSLAVSNGKPHRRVWAWGRRAQQVPSQKTDVYGRSHSAVQDLRTSLPLAVGDLLSVIVGLSMASGLAQLLGLTIGLNAPFVLSNATVTLIALAIRGLYPGCGLTAIAELRSVALTSTMVQVSFIAAITTAYPGSASEYIALAAAMALPIALLPVTRMLVRFWCRGSSWWAQPVTIVGDGHQDRELFEALRKDSASGLRPAHIVQMPNGFDQLDNVDPSRVDEFRQQLFRQGSRRVIVAPGAAACVDTLLQPGMGVAHVHVLSPRQDAPSLWCAGGERAGRTEIQFTDSLAIPLARMCKRTMDVGFILLASPLILPLTLGLAAIVKVTSKGPAFYCQKRLTTGGRHFFAWKFRSMVTNADEVLQKVLAKDPELRDEWARDHKLKQDPRITAIGSLLRKTSLDELPQLWNVLMGDMSLVGPRPIVDDEIGKYGEVYQLYKMVLPGITGLWQISGRNNTSYAERLDYDRYYVRNWSPWLDLFILLRTVKTVLLREGAY